MENFKMRRNGGELLRATENTEEHNISTNSAKTMAAYGMTDSGVNYGTTALNMHEPGHEEKPKKKLGTEGMTVEEKIQYYKQQNENSKNKKNSSIKMGIGSNRSSGQNILSYN